MTEIKSVFKMETPFKIINNDRVYGIMDEYGKKNFTEYEKFYLLNRMKHFVQSNINRNYHLYYDFDRTDTETRFYIKCKDTNGEINLDKYKPVLNKYVEKMKTGRLVLYDLNYDLPEEQQEVEIEIPFIEHIVDVKVKNNIIFGKIMTENFLSLLSKFQSEIKIIKKKKDYIYIGNSCINKFNVSRIIKDATFCDGFLVDSKEKKKDFRFALSLPQISLKQILKTENKNYNFKVVDQFKKYSEIICVDENNNNTSAPEINYKKTKDIVITGHPKLIRDSFYFYTGIKDIVFVNDKPLDQIEIYETQYLKIKTLTQIPYNYLCRCPLVLMMNLNLYSTDGFFFYKGSRNYNFEEDTQNTLRLLEKDHFWYDLENAFDFTYDLILEIQEIYGGEIVGLFDNKYVISKDLNLEKVLDIKMGKFIFQEDILFPGTLVSKNNIEGDYQEIHIDGKILELKKEITQSDWTTGKVVSSWAKFYFKKTGKISCYYLK